MTQTYGNTAFHDEVHARAELSCSSKESMRGPPSSHHNVRTTARGTLVRPKGPNFEIKLAFRAEDALSQRLQNVDAEYQQYREQQLGMVKVQMTAEQVRKVQLSKLFAMSMDFQKARLKDFMSNLLRSVMMKDEYNRELVNQYLKESQDLKLIQLGETKIDMTFKNWAPDLDDVPMSMRENVARLQRPKVFKLREKVLDFDNENQDMYLVTEGTAVLFQNKYSFEKFMKSMDTAMA